MTLRTMIGTGWALLCGLAGGWLVLMPWALSVQGNGDWTTVTKVSFGTGLGLLVFSLVGLGLVGTQMVRLMAPPRRRAEAREARAEEQANQESVDRALLQLATKLVADLDAPAPAPSSPAPAAVAAFTGGSPSSAPAANPAASGDLASPGVSNPRGDGAPTWRRVEE